MRCRTLILIHLVLALGTLLPAHPSTPRETEGELLRESLGQLAAQSLYATYLAIGAISDGSAQGVYEHDTALPLLLHLNRLSDAMSAQMEKLLSSGFLHGEDLVAVQSLMDASQLLSAQARAYRDHLRTGSQSHLRIYEEKRKAAWERIASILQLED